MLICGLKLTHDASVAVLQGNQLLFCVEMEKLANNRRHRTVEDLGEISGILKTFGFSPADMDEFVIDGWGEESFVPVKNGKENLRLPVAPYRERSSRDSVMETHAFEGLVLDQVRYGYTSYAHLAGHIAGAWATSPFGQQGEDAFVLAWDGGTYPRLYYVDAARNLVEARGHLFLFIGHIYAIFSKNFEPFCREAGIANANLSVPGKVMAYIALGQPRDELLQTLWEVYDTCFEPTMQFAEKFSQAFKQRTNVREFSDADVLASFHVFLERLLVEKLEEKLRQYPENKTQNLCFVGGCALNIKWNSAIRNSGVSSHFWVPPFANDAGSALGAACCALFKHKGFQKIDWSVFSGPAIVTDSVPSNWKGRTCSIGELASHFHRTQAPVIFLNGRAEIGPRALGNRSIFAPATSAQMKDLLNMAKEREFYRPVAPICLEEKAPEIFDPGCPDPYMLFDHQVRKEWINRIPAVVHLDGTARLQTVNALENPEVAALLTEYEKLSGIPLLCNTSANFKGAGFFPDISSAARWDKVNYIWCNQVLYEKSI